MFIKISTFSLIPVETGLNATAATAEEPHSSKPNVANCPVTQEHWERLMNKSLSGSEFELIMHSHTFPSADTLTRQIEDDENKDAKTPMSV